MNHNLGLPVCSIFDVLLRRNLGITTPVREPLTQMRIMHFLLGTSYSTLREENSTPNCDEIEKASFRKTSSFYLKVLLINTKLKTDQS